MNSHNEQLPTLDTEEEMDDLYLPPSPILRRMFAAHSLCLTIEGTIEISQEYDLEDSSNQDLKKINQNNEHKFILLDEELKGLLTIKNIKEKTRITNEEELEYLSKTCAQIFFQLLKNNLLKIPDDYPKIMDRLLDYDIVFLEKVAIRLKESDMTQQSLEDIFSAVAKPFVREIHKSEVILPDLLNITSEYNNLPRLTLYAPKKKIDNQEKTQTLEPSSP